MRRRQRRLGKQAFKRVREYVIDHLDETIEESFPASDAPANTPETGIGVNGSNPPDEKAPVEPDDADIESETAES